MKTENLKVSIIIPNFNGEALLSKNLPEVLMAFRERVNQINEVIVVDDGSDDGSVKLLKTQFPEVKVIKHTENRGFSAAVNTGVRSSFGDLVVLLNSDVIPAVDFLEKVIPHFADPKLFAVSLHEVGYGWGRGYFEHGLIQIGKGEESAFFHDSLYASGGSGVFRRDTWIKLGGFDEELFSPFYWEDVDLGYRAAKRGYLLGWEPQAKVIHQHESTISKLSPQKVRRIQERNQLLFTCKNLTSKNLVRKHTLGLMTYLSRHPGYLKVMLLTLPKLGIIIKKNQKERREAKISDEAIFARF